MPTQQSGDWYDEVKQLTTRLVRMRSVSPGQGEIAVAREIARMLQEGGLDDAYDEIGLQALEYDRAGRLNAYAFLRGRGAQTLVLLGHFDTVDTGDYGTLEPFAYDPDALADHVDELAELAPGLAEDLAAHPGDWMFGRGCADMKSGVALNIAIMRHMAERKRRGELDISLLLLATPDEENESAGVLAGVQLLLDLREKYGLQYLGAINTDYTTALYPGDPHRYVFTGTIGKMLPTFLAIGHASHVGDPFDGFDANLLAAELIRDLSMNDELCDVVRGQRTPPPVTLKASDLKTRYDVQLPFAAYFYLNVLTYSTTPAQLLERLRIYARNAMERVLRRVDEVELRWTGYHSQAPARDRHQQRSGIVLTYAELYDDVLQKLGEQRLNAEMTAAWEAMPSDLDSRGRCLHLARYLWTLSGKRGPAVILYYSPPFIPHVAGTPCVLHEVIHAVAGAHPELRVLEYFPFISDMSYLRLDTDVKTDALISNIPTWPDTSRRPGAYHLPLEAIRELGLPVVDFGPYGKGAHQAGERLLMSYAFDALPRLLNEVIERLAQKAREGTVM